MLRQLTGAQRRCCATLAARNSCRVGAVSSKISSSMHLQRAMMTARWASSSSGPSEPSKAPAAHPKAPAESPGPGSAAAEHADVFPESSAKLTSGGSSASEPRGPISWATFALLVALGGGVLGYFNIKRAEKKREAQTRVETYGKPALGGPWSLVDSDGRPFSSGDLLGQYYLLYFGFTYCPDICPNELVKMARVTDAVAAHAAATGTPSIRPVFITVDPYRDSCAQVGAYVKDFHPRMLGLTGTPGQVAKAAKAFRVFFQEVDREADSEDYLVDHSIVMYLIGPDGDFLEFYTQLMTSAEIIEKVKAVIAANQPPPLSLAERAIRALGFGKQ